MPETSGKRSRDYSKFDNMSTEMLEDILRADSHLPDDENSDTDAILYIMEVIAKREKEHSTGKFTDVRDAWASFSENYMPYIEDGKSLYDFGDEKEIGVIQTPSVQRQLKKRRLMRVACVAAAVTVLLLASTITASAFGFDLWGAVAKWTKDTFGFSISKVEGSPQINGEIDENSLQDTLNKYGITAELAPKWFPEGYSMKNINVDETPAQTIIAAQYSGQNGDILLNIILLAKPSTRTYEKDGENVTIYLKNGIEHYIMSNLDQIKIVWQSENLECSISGPFTQNEAEKMIDSIYERN